MKRGLAVLLAAALLGCSGEEPEAPAPEPIFPADFETAWQEARSCRFSHDHELRSSRVFADADAFVPYTTWSEPYPPGATIVKIEYEDDLCQKVQGYSAMQKLVVGSEPELGDWRWQKLDAELRVRSSADLPARCIGCHAYHCRSPWGFDLACGEDLPF